MSAHQRRTQRIAVTVRTPAEPPQLTPGAARALLSLLRRAAADPSAATGPSVDPGHPSAPARAASGRTDPPAATRAEGQTRRAS